MCMTWPISNVGKAAGGFVGGSSGHARSESFIIAAFAITKRAPQLWGSRSTREKLPM
jgi:hypothetical protein